MIPVIFLQRFWKHRKCWTSISESYNIFKSVPAPIRAFPDSLNQSWLLHPLCFHGNFINLWVAFISQPFAWWCPVCFSACVTSRWKPVSCSSSPCPTVQSTELCTWWLIAEQLLIGWMKPLSKQLQMNNLRNIRVHSNPLIQCFSNFANKVYKNAFQ